MQYDFDVDDQVLYRVQEDRNLWKKGIIKTIITNCQPLRYVVQNQNGEKVCVYDVRLPASQKRDQKAQRKLSHHSEIPSPALEREASQLDLEFQRILSLLVLQKNHDTVVAELHNLLKRVNSELLLKMTNGTKIVSATYQFLQLRKSSIMRNYPFAQTKRVLNLLKKLISQTKKSLLEKFGLDTPVQKPFSQKPTPEFVEKSQAIHKLRKMSLKSATTEESEKEEQPTAFFENIKPTGISSFRPYKSNHQSNQQQSAHPRALPGKSKPIIFKPIILCPPQMQIVA